VYLLYGAGTWRTTQSAALVYMKRKPGGQRRVGLLFYGAETWTMQSVDLLYMERKSGGPRRVWVCFIWSGNLEVNAECGSALYGAEIWRATQSVDLVYMKRKPGGQHRVWVCFKLIGNLEDNAECAWVCLICHKTHGNWKTRLF
jgi:hypothetical protein